MKQPTKESKLDRFEKWASYRGITLVGGCAVVDLSATHGVVAVGLFGAGLLATNEVQYRVANAWRNWRHKHVWEPYTHQVIRQGDPLLFGDMTHRITYRCDECQSTKSEEIDGVWSIHALRERANGNLSVKPSYGI